QDALHELADLMKRYDDRLTLERRDFGQRYIEGRLDIGLELRARGDGDKFHLVISRCNIGPKKNCEFAVVAPHEQFGRLPPFGNDEVIGSRVCDHLGAETITQSDK